MTVNVIGSKYEISIVPMSGIRRRETEIFRSAYQVFGGNTISVFIGVDGGETVIRIVGYETLNESDSFHGRLDALNQLLNHV